MIYCIANVDERGYSPADIRYTHGKFVDFVAWLLNLNAVQLDFETPMIECMPLTKLRTVQFGEYKPFSDKDQWVIEWKLLSNKEKIFILTYLQDPKIVKYIHNAAFEYQMLLNYNCVMDNVVDTMLSEKIIYTGYGHMLDEDGATFYSLESVARRRLEVELDKDYQKLFGFDYPLTPGHIHYAAQDVIVLDDINYRQQEMLETYYGQRVAKEDRTVFNHLPTLEYEASLAFGDMMYNGMKLDQEKWLKNLSEVEPILAKYRDALNVYITSDIAEPELYDAAIRLGYLSQSDRININWNSPKQKRQLLTFAFPDIPGATQPILKKYLRDNPELVNTVAGNVIANLSEGNYEPFFEMLIEHCREDLIKMGFITPPGQTTINWNSSDQVLPLLKAIKKGVQDTNEQTLSKLEHPIGYSLLDYRGALKLTTSYGEKFLTKVNVDGNVRTNFNQIVDTGRVSSAKPNMQQIPVIDDDDPLVVNKYRSCFIPDNEDEVFVDGDYSSQELVIIAEMSRDPVWMEALRNGWDLHSICASLVHGKEWTKQALDTCKFALNKKKCKCPGHIRMRNGIKTINFGLAYGMSQFKLSATLKITVKEAEALIDKYFKTFPAIKGKLTTLGHYAIIKGHILTLKPYFRIRWYPTWDRVRQHVDYHIKGIQYNSLLGSIERTGKNTPIQGSSADMTKLALVLVRREINQNKLRGTVKLVMQVHDQITTSSKKHFAEQWKVKLTELMEQAAKVIIPSGLLKAEVGITERWQK